MTKFLIFLLIVGGLYFTWVGMTAKSALYTGCMSSYNNDDACTCFSNKIIDTLGGPTLTGFNIYTQEELVDNLATESLKACSLSKTDLVIEAIKKEVMNKFLKNK